MIELMRGNTKRKKPGLAPKITKQVLRDIQQQRPPKREGRMEYYRSIAAGLGVSVGAITQAEQRSKKV